MRIGIFFGLPPSEAIASSFVRVISRKLSPKCGTQTRETAPSQRLVPTILRCCADAMADRKTCSKLRPIIPH
jgi:hypothetical protein